MIWKVVGLIWLQRYWDVSQIADALMLQVLKSNKYFFVLMIQNSCCLISLICVISSLFRLSLFSVRYQFVTGEHLWTKQIRENISWIFWQYCSKTCEQIMPVCEFVFTCVLDALLDYIFLDDINGSFCEERN